jgi:adenylylsulfate kinase-like enzyme
VSSSDIDHRSSSERNSGRLPSLIVIRGNSGSGKSSTALAVRRAAGRGVALVQQDTIRQDLLRERDRPGGLNVELIALNVRFCLEHDYDVILEGILYTKHYGPMVRSLIAEHRGPSFVYYYDLPLSETLRRHASKPNAHEFGEKELSEWYVQGDMLGVAGEQLIGAEQTQEETVAHILAQALPPRQRPEG